MRSIVPLLDDLLEIDDACAGFGSVASRIPGVTLFWSTELIRRKPLVYAPGIVIVGRGHKVGYLGDRVFEYDPNSYLLVGVPLPFECESHGTPEEPLVGMRIDLDFAALHACVMRMNGRLPFDDRSATVEPESAVEPVAMDDGMQDATIRLLKCLRDERDSLVLGAAAVQEVLYRALCSAKGQVLYGLTQQHTQYAAVARALQMIHRDYRAPLRVDDLAQESAMSVSSFHRAFKRVTGDSPLQYLKKIRLDKARGLLMHENLQVSAAAYEVGYESPSQFSREFKRHFDMPPSAARAAEESLAV